MFHKNQSTPAAKSADRFNLRSYLTRFFAARKSVELVDIERTPDSPGNFCYEVLTLRAVKDSDMGDGFGASILFQIEDDAEVENDIMVLQARRNGADDTGSFRVGLQNAGSWKFPFWVFSLGGIGMIERSSDPPDPSEGSCVLWMSDGTGSGDDGDIMIKITAGGTTKTGMLKDFSEI